MLANLEALAALAEAGTMTRAATRLRVTQSAVSKRIAALADELGFAVVEPDGRRVKLTPAGVAVLERAGPLLVELRAALTHEHTDTSGVVSIGVSESILASWGAAALAAARAAVPGLELTIGAHRSPVAIDRVRAGEYALALVAGAPGMAGELGQVALGSEEMVLVPSGLRRFRLRTDAPLPVLAIEPGSATGRALRSGLAALRRQHGLHLVTDRPVQSLACVVQMARAGFGHGLVPRALARAMGVADRSLITLPRPGLRRPVVVVGRRLVLGRPLVAGFVAALEDATRAVAVGPTRG